MGYICYACTNTELRVCRYDIGVHCWTCAVSPFSCCEDAARFKQIAASLHRPPTKPKLMSGCRG